MISTKKLQEIYNKSKLPAGGNQYLDFDSFRRSAKEFIATMKKGGRTVCSIQVSKSGMSRRFNFDGDINLALNIVYNGKRSYDAVKVGGCNMDMHWDLKFTVISFLLTPSELAKGARERSYNSISSNGVVL